MIVATTLKRIRVMCAYYTGEHGERPFSTKELNNFLAKVKLLTDSVRLYVCLLYTSRCV